MPVRSRGRDRHLGVADKAIASTAHYHDGYPMRTMASFPAADGMSQLLLRLTVSSTAYCLRPGGEKLAKYFGPR
jgi:hypothetical protein